MNTFNQLNFSSSPISPLLPDYLKMYKNNTSTGLNNLGFNIGLLTSNSPNYNTALQGLGMMNNAFNSINNFQSSNSPNYSSNINLNQGFNALNLMGLSIGGTAGNVLSGIGKIGSSINLINAANKGIAGGLEGAKNLKSGGVGAAIGAASDLLGSFLPEKQEYEGDKGNITQTMDTIYDGISDAAMAFGPVGMMVGGIMKGGALLGKGMNALGGGTDAMTSTDAILGSSFLNLTPLGLINGFGGKKTNSFTKDDEAFANIGSSYTGSNSTINDALSKSNKKYGLLSSRARIKANNEIEEAQKLQALISDISEDATLLNTLKSSMSAINGNTRNFKLNGGYNLAAIRVGQKGMSIELIDTADIPEFQNRNSTTNIELIDIAVIPEFQNGGSINVIPDGALHARKHNMDLKGVTKKGIPVVSIEDNILCAEIEKEEVIFRLEVTQKLEKWYNKYYNLDISLREKDEYALKAGELLINELLYNTKDNVGIL